VNAYGVISLVGLSRLAPLCGSFLPVLNPVVIPGLRAWYLCCPAWQLVDCVCVNKCLCHLLIKNYFTFCNQPVVVDKLLITLIGLLMRNMTVELPGI